MGGQTKASVCNKAAWDMIGILARYNFVRDLLMDILKIW